MCFIAEAEPISAISEKRNTDNTVYKITTREGRAFVCLAALQIHINTELGGKILFYKNGIYACYWEHLEDFFSKQGITLPDEKVPCTNCDGGQCSILCNRDRETKINQTTIACAVA